MLHKLWDRVNAAWVGEDRHARTRVAREPVTPHTRIWLSLETVTQALGNGAVADLAVHRVGGRVSKVGVEHAAVSLVAHAPREISNARPGVAAVAPLRRRVHGLHAHDALHRLRMSRHGRGPAILPQPEVSSHKPPLDDGFETTSFLPDVGGEAAHPGQDEIAVVEGR